MMQRRRSHLSGGTLPLPRALALLAAVAATTVVGDGSHHHGFAVEEKGEGLKYASDPPGYFPTDFVSVPLIDVRDETRDSKVLTFGLPEGESLSLPVSSAILLRVPPAPGGDAADGDGDGATEEEGKKKKKKPKAIVRPYNPITSNDVVGSFSLLVKFYPGGAAGDYLSSLEVGDSAAFKQVKGNVKKFRHPFRNASSGAAVTRITMLAGGTGIAPMVQALRAILAQPDGPAVRLLYGNRGEDDIMLRGELEAMQAERPGRLRIHYVVGEADEGEGACGDGGDGAEGTCDDGGGGYETGWINEEKIRRLGFPPNEEGTSVVWICGVDAMYESLAGSRMKPLKEGTPVHNLGFCEDTVWRS